MRGCESKKSGRYNKKHPSNQLLDSRPERVPYTCSGLVDLETVSDEGYWREVDSIKGIDVPSCSRGIDRRRG